MRKKTIASVAAQLLKKVERPLHYRELTQRVLRLMPLSGATPWETLRSRIGTSPTFKRVGAGVYGLAEWKEYKEARFAKDIAYDILKSRGKGMTASDLGKEILKERSFVSPPGAIGRMATNRDKRFQRDPDRALITLADS